MPTIDNLSFAALHRIAAREIDRQLLARELARIDAASHVAVYRDVVHCYGTAAECHAFAEGLRSVAVRAMTDKDRIVQARHKRAVWRTR